MQFRIHFCFVCFKVSQEASASIICNCEVFENFLVYIAKSYLAWMVYFILIQIKWIYICQLIDHPINVRILSLIGLPQSGHLSLTFVHSTQYLWWVQGRNKAFIWFLWQIWHRSMLLSRWFCSIKVSEMVIVFLFI